MTIHSSTTSAPSRVSRRAVVGGSGAVGLAACLSWSGVSSSLAVETARQSPSSADAIYTWVAWLFDTVKTRKLSPPRAARIYAYTLQAMYEAAASAEGGPRLAGLSPVFPTEIAPHADVDWVVAMSQAAATCAAELFGTNDAETNQLLLGHILVRQQQGVSALVIDDSRGHGRVIASAVLRYARQDGMGSLPTSYTPPSGSGAWVPTLPAQAPALEPYWGRVKTLALSNGGEVKPVARIPFSTATSSEMYKQAKTVYDTVNNLTAEQRATAEYWSDDPGLTGTPGGHWMIIAAKCCADQAYQPLPALEAIMLVAASLHDAFVSCWTAKYAHNLMRPITYIREYIDADWMPILNTPPFPEYTSGHSVSSGAASVVLATVMGDIVFTDTCHDALGKGTREFSTFAQAANEAADSRLFGGIHFPMGNINGLAQGRRVGQLVVQRLRPRR